METKEKASVAESITVMDSAEAMEVRKEMKRQEVIEKLKAMDERIKKLGAVEAEFFPKTNHDQMV